MSMFQTHKISFLITLALLFLLPIFFIPGGALNLDVAKSALAVFGIIAIVLVFLLEIWREGKLNVPWHPFIFTIALLPLVYLLSAFLATPSSLSLLGYNFEVGTFGFMLLGSLILILAATIFSDTTRSLQALVAFFVSISIVALLVTIKVLFGGDILVLGNFFGNMGNPIGNWTDLAVSFGLLSVFAAFSLGMIPMKLSIRILVYGVFVLGTALLVIINFYTALVLTFGASVFLFFYFWKIEKHFFNTAATLPSASKNFLLKPVFLPVVLGIISLIFLVNPTIPGTRGTLGDVVSGVFKIENIDVRPSFSATLGISKVVLSQGGLLGSGPNTFGRDWLIYKPVDVNTTPFWAVAFPFGVGFIPTQVASIGMLGTALWLILFVFLVLLGVKLLNRVPESRAERFTLVSVLLITFFLWIASFLYAPSATILMFAFIFSGFFVSVSRGSGIIPSRLLILKEPSQNRFISIILMAVITLGVVFLGWAGFNRTVSAIYFKKAIELSNTAGVSLAEVEEKLDTAVRFSKLDTYYVALSRINFAKAQVAANATTSTPEENRATFEGALRKSIEAAKLAVSANPAGYQNWVSLGMIYSALVPEPLSVVGSYENAFFAYSEASKRNPNNPELPLFLARLEFNRGNIEGALSFIRKSIALKEDYADAYLLLAQLEVRAGNTAGAILSAERLASLMPNNPGVYFELGLLKYSNKDYTGAADTFARALSLAPDYANAKYYLGLTLAQLGQLDEARKQFEELLISNPDSEEVKAILRELNGS
ncbi:MAG: tetratricopeptide repeat protein [bacterium]|nr:tetratricopeptide repeat protein [bacterium]